MPVVQKERDLSEQAQIASVPEHLALLEAVSASSTFAKSPTLRKLLLYLWEHRDEPINEYAIAIDVFGKRATFDSKFDATVRVQISRLRQKLKEYFETEGVNHHVRMAVPQGSHRLELHAFSHTNGRSALVKRVRPVVLPAAVGILALLGGLLALQNSRLRSELRETQQQMQLPELWRTMLRPQRVTRVVYPIPVFYSWDKLRVRDVTINAPDGWRDSGRLKPFVDLYGEPSLSQSYSVASDTLAAIQLTRFLSSRGVPLEVSPTASLSLDQYGSDNLVFLGIPPTNAALEKYSERTNFLLLPGQSSVENRRPRRGEPGIFRESGSSDTRRTTRFGIIAVLPGHAPDSSLVLLMGLQTASLAIFLTSPPSLEAFENQWREAGRPPHFEAVVRADLDGGRTKTAESIAFRSIR